MNMSIDHISPGATLALNQKLQVLPAIFHQLLT